MTASASTQTYIACLVPLGLAKAGSQGAVLPLPLSWPALLPSQVCILLAPNLSVLPATPPLPGLLTNLQSPCPPSLVTEPPAPRPGGWCARRLVCRIQVSGPEPQHLPVPPPVQGHLSSRPWPWSLAAPPPPRTWASPGSAGSALLLPPAGSPEAAAGPRSRMSSSAMVNWASVFTICSIRPACRRGRGAGAAGVYGPPPSHRRSLRGLSRAAAAVARCQFQRRSDGGGRARGGAVASSARVRPASPARGAAGGAEEGGSRPLPGHPRLHAAPSPATRKRRPTSTPPLRHTAVSALGPTSL